MMQLENYTKGSYNSGAGMLKRALWFVISVFFFENPLFVWIRPKVVILRLFGARVGKDFYIKPNVKIKYPWQLQIGNNVSIGERVWIDNLVLVEIGNNVVISQNAYLLTGNHDFTSPSFDLFVRSIVIEDGVWIGASVVICPGVICKENTVISVGSMLKNSTERNGIYLGNPAKFVKNRKFKSYEK